MPVKSNLSTAAGLVYRTVKKGNDVVVEWLGEAKCSPQELAGAGRNENSALMEAAYVLYSILANGPVRANEAIKLAGQAAVSKRTLLRAKALLGVKSRKRGSGKESLWTWELSDDESLLRPFKDKDLDDLMDRLLHGEDEGPPLPGDEWKYRGGDNFDKGSDDDEDDEDQFQP
jgi:hypothetical protein